MVCTIGIVPDGNWLRLWLTQYILAPAPAGDWKTLSPRIVSKEVAQRLYLRATSESKVLLRAAMVSFLSPATAGVRQVCRGHPHFVSIGKNKLPPSRSNGTT